MEGLPFDGVDDKHLFTQFVGLRTLLAGMGKTLGNRLGVWGTLQRQKIVFEREYGFQTTFCQNFADKYLKRFQEADYYENVYHLTVVIKTDYLDAGIKEAEEQIQILMRSLEPYDPYLLTAYQNENGVPFSEVYSFFGSLINGSYEEIPLSTVDAYQTIAGSNLHFGSDLCEIRAQNGTRKFAQMFDLRDFGVSKPKILTSILRLPCEFTFTQSLVFINPYEMQGEIRKKLNDLDSVNDKAVRQIEELEEGQGLLTSGELMFGDYHAALVVYGKTAEEAASNGARAYSTFLNSGSYRFTKAGLSAPATFFSQVPGSREKPRSFPKTTTNFACTFGIHNYSHGKKLGNPIGDGTAIIPLQTTSKTIYDFNFHFSNPKEDNVGDKIAGHTLMLGATGTGKTTLQTAMMAFAERFKPYMFVMDLDKGMEIFIRSIGGSYFALEAGEPTGLNPFQLVDTPANREFLYGLVGMCGADENGKLTATEEQEIQFAVDTVFSLDFENRHFSHLLQSIPISPDPNSLRVRLSKWCRSEGGRFAWCLDNPTNLFNPEQFYRVGFDLTDILKDNYPPTAPVLAYMFHLRNIMMDKVAKENGILATIIEEFWYAARFEALQDIMLKILKTDRKLGGWLILVSQSPEDAINCPIFPAIVQQTPTKVFLPNPDAEYENSYERCGLTEKEFDELAKLSLESRTFLVKQSKQSAFAMLDLYGFQDEMAFLSGSSDNVELLHRVMEDVGSENPEVWYRPFVEALQQRRAEKKNVRTV
ncbi:MULTISPECIES: conjugal transfer protein [unclassified Neisseria]|nr:MULTISPECIES: conjugal transfer protein [unclassified Neisseria]MDO1509547.1 conjugal transfer protein [Neisseria sp. MVDL19-042950]MDO1515681.1 conjugal transfer protein [Neisseria sp. MVDL18-041461]MDO1563495.1 conjugal transfer protein [Neisseria sp. MVDL20-010259]